MLRRNLATSVLLVLAACCIATASAQQGKDKQSSTAVRFKQVLVQDELLKQPACTFLIPAEWNWESKIFWRLHPVYPATGAFATTKPGSVEQIIVYPQLPFVDGVRQMAAETAKIAGPDAIKFAMNSFPEGGDYMGSEVRMIVTPQKYVEEVVIKRFRKDISNYKVVKAENIPNGGKGSALPADIGKGIVSKTAAARVRIEYTLNGRTIHEDFFVLMSSMSVQQMTYWGTETASSVRAEAGQLDKLHPLHQTVVNSLRIDEKWFARYVQAAQMVQKTIQGQIKLAGDISRIVTETNNHVSKTISDTYWSRQESMNRINHQFSNYIRGVDDYIVPGSNYSVSLPSGYNQVWSNGQGEYILSNDSNFNPNQQFNGNWQQARPKGEGWSDKMTR